MRHTVLPLAFALFAACAAAEETSLAVVTTPEGPLELSSSEVKGEDGVHLVFFSDREDANWKVVEPGETRLMIMIHMSLGAGTHACPAFSTDDLEGLFDMGKGNPARALTAYLFTNTGKEPVRFKLNAAVDEHFATTGGVVIREDPAFKQALSADFAFVFRDRQVAGRVRFSR